MKNSTWYDAEKVSQPGSVILTKWLSDRKRSRGVSDSTDWMLFGPPSAGQVVNEITAKRVAAVYACVRLIAGAIASLPLTIYQRTSDGRQKADHPIWWLLNEQPHAMWSSASMFEYLISCMLLVSDGFAEIVRNLNGEVLALIPIDPRIVTVREVDGRLRYDVRPIGKPAYGRDQDDVLHFAGFGFNGLRGESVIANAAKNAIGTALAADEYSGAFFANGARPDFVLQTDGKLDDAAAKLLRSTWAERHSGVANAHLPAVLTGGLKVEQLTMSAEDAQLLATRQWQVVDIARAFGVPPHMIGETDKASSWGSGIEQMSIGFVKFTLAPYLNRIEQELNRKLFRISRYFCEFNADGLMRGDSAAQAALFSKALGGPGSQGWMTINEVRRIQNLPPVSGGDEIIKSGAGNVQEANKATSG